MHRDSLVVAVKTADGKVLREDTLSSSIPTVFLPFNSEYLILLKNQHKRRAVVQVEIDGQDVAPGYKLVLQSGGELDLERWMLDGDREHGRRFKFVSKDHPAVDTPEFGGNGSVRVTWQFEKEPEKPLPAPIVIHEYHDWDWYPRWIPMRPYRYTPYYDPAPYTVTCGATYTANGNVGVRSVSNCSNQVDTSGAQGYSGMGSMEGRLVNNAAPADSVRMVFSAQQVGATVQGSDSNQKFHTTYIGELETETHELVIRILAPPVVEGKEAKPVTVESTRDLYCPACGKKVTYNDRFCRHCGQQLVKITG
jgi:hypothetical protein